MKFFRSGFPAEFNDRTPHLFPQPVGKFAINSLDLLFMRHDGLFFPADILAERPAPLLQTLQKQTSPLAVFFQIAGAALFHFGTK